MSLERASFVLPLCTNVITTALILSRIWWVSRAIGGSSTTRRAIHVIIESGSLYFLVQIMLVILYGIQSGGATIMISIAVQTYVCPLYLLNREVLSFGAGHRVDAHNHTRLSWAVLGIASDICILAADAVQHHRSHEPHRTRFSCRDLRDQSATSV